MTMETRISWWTLGLGLAAAAGVSVWDARAGLGVGLGAGLSLINYLWLKAGATALTTSGKRMMWGAAARFPLRFGLLGLCLCGIFISHLAPFAWVLGGLFAAPAATLAVSVGQLAENSSDR